MKLIKIFSSLLTPIIEILAVYIAFQQYKIGKKNLKLALYEKRYEIYKEIMKTLMLIIQNPKIHYIEEFEKKNRQIVFLFKMI